MKGRGNFLQRLRTAGLLLALFGLTFKALLPPGYMLTPVGDQLVVALCSVDGADIAINAPGKHAPADQQSGHDAPCAFALTAHASTPVAELIAAPSNEAGDLVEAPHLRSTHVASLAAPPPFATGPPLSL